MKNLSANNLVIMKANEGQKGEVITSVTVFADSISNAVKSVKGFVDGAYLVLQKAAIPDEFNRLSTFARLSDRPARGRRFNRGRRPIIEAQAA
jgi:hypothetical protein